MVSPELVHGLVAARQRMTQDAWQRLAASLAPKDTIPDASSSRTAIAGLLSQDAAWLLSQAFGKHGGAKWTEIAAAMAAIDTLASGNAPSPEIIWTGPAHNRFPVRRIDQVLYDLVSRATRSILLVTFAAHRIRHLCEHLSRAVQRGVQLTLIVESEGESEGQLTHDAVAAFKDVPASRTHIYYWPLQKRDRNQAGRPGKLHVKCAIVDEVAIIGSANLTDDAFNHNMELGLLVRDPQTVLSLAEHFRELIRQGTLEEVHHRS